MTETGFVRVSSNARAIPEARTPSEAVALLRRIRALPGHVFWSDDVSPTDADARAFEVLVGHRQVSDAHLLTLARKRGGTLVTLDRGVVELSADGPMSVELIS
jgi:predicted nucleic acid-binding protein